MEGGEKLRYRRYVSCFTPVLKAHRFFTVRWRFLYETLLPHPKQKKQSQSFVVSPRAMRITHRDATADFETG